MSLRDDLIAIHKQIAPCLGRVALMLERPNMSLSQIKEFEAGLKKSLALVSALVTAAEEKKRLMKSG